jgi:hypothetical protein
MIHKLYSDIENILSKIDFNNIWQGFSYGDFALYNQETVYLKDKTIPWDHRFLGNTVIDFEGNYIAIWELESIQNNDTDYLAADMVHEMFHVHQKKNGESRFADDLELLAYPDNLDNYQLKIVETELLIKAFNNKDIMALMQFINIRNIRKILIGDIIYQEYRAETLEGMAEYASLVSLQQINSEKYKIRLEDYISKLINNIDLIFDTRRMAYYSGAILCLTLKLLNIDFYHELSIEKTLFEIINKDSNVFIEDYYKYMENKKQKFDIFMKNHTELVECDEYICGYDPMNMIRFENKILCNNFVMIGNNFIKGPVMVILKNGTTNHIESYLR